jgi:hypothetical protein
VDNHLDHPERLRWPAGFDRVLATSTARQWAHLQNISGASNTVYCNLSDASSTLNNGLMITASSSFTINAENLYIGSVQCMAQASTTVLVTAQQ